MSRLSLLIMICALIAIGSFYLGRVLIYESKECVIDGGIIVQRGCEIKVYITFLIDSPSCWKLSNVDFSVVKGQGDVRVVAKRLRFGKQIHGSASRRGTWLGPITPNEDSLCLSFPQSQTQDVHLRNISIDIAEGTDKVCLSGVCEKWFTSMKYNPTPLSLADWVDTLGDYPP